MSTEIVKIDSNDFVVKMTTSKELAEMVTERVGKVLPTLPKDLTTLEVVKGDKIEENVSTLINDISAKAKQSKDNRLVLTRQLDDIKKAFTSNEKVIDEEVGKLSDFVNSWNSEKLKRKRKEEEEQEKAHARKNLLIEFKSKVSNHYTALINDFIFGTKQKIENDFYDLDAEKLDTFDKINIKDESQSITEFLRAHLKANRLQFDKSDEELKQIEIELLTEMKPDLAKAIEDIIALYEKMKEFIPSRKKQLEKQSEESKAEEQKKLAEKQAKEKAEAESKAKAKAEEELQNSKISAAMEAAEAKPTADLSKGANVKLKYQPTNHKELLKMVQHYIGEHYANEDFEKLNTRLSFMRTACDSDLNKDGVIIEGVPTEEIVTKRKSSK